MTKKALSFKLALQVEAFEDGKYIVSHPYLGAFGDGETVKEAVTECVCQLLDLYENLIESEATLGRALCKELQLLNRIFSCEMT